MRQCPKCNTTKPLTEFYNNVRTPTGKSHHCKACMKRDSKLRYKNRKDPKPSIMDLI